ncbi:MAG: tetratricopeptide repeat protein [Nitrospirota bacterium]|nr:tetratricopeptide repeat protein [Nitrospirota bacterium]
MKNAFIFFLIVTALAMLEACTPPPQPDSLFPPTASDLELLGQTKLCDKKPLTVKQWKGTTYTREPWGTGEQFHRTAQSIQPSHDRFYFFDDEGLLIGAVFRFIPGLDLQPYPVLRGTIAELPPSSSFFLDPSQLLGQEAAQSANLYRTGDKTSTTQYLILDNDDRPRLLVASMVIDPYEQLLTSYQRKFLPGLVRPSPPATNSNTTNKTSDKMKGFLATQQFARGEAALFASCGKRNADTAVLAYQAAISHGISDDKRLAEAHHRLGLALRDKGRAQEAEAQLEKALIIRPNVPEVINNLGSILAQQDKKVRALELFKKAIVLRPNYARARFNLAECLETIQVKRAIEEYETYLALVEGVPGEEQRVKLVVERVKRLKGNR